MPDGPPSSASSDQAAGDGLLRHVFDALEDRVAIVDASGTIVETNRAWDRFANHTGGQAGPGANYLEETRRAARDGDPIAADVHAKLDALLDKGEGAFELEYPCHSEEQEQWFRVTAVCFQVEDASYVATAHREITEEWVARVEAEDLHLALQNRDAVMNRLTGALPQILWLVDAELEEVLFASPDVDAFWGLPRERLLSDPFAWMDVVHPEDREALAANIEADLTRIRQAEDAAPETDFRIQHGQTGEERWIRLQGVPILEEGDLVAVGGICEDITERKTREAERERLQQIVEAAPEGVGIAQPDGTVIYLNPQLRELAGLDAGTDAATLHVKQFHPPETYKALMDEWLPIAIETGSWRGESRIKTQSGDLIPVLQTITAHRDHDGELTHVSTIVRDIRPMKAAEATLRESEQRFRELAEHIEEVFWINDAAFEETIYISPAYEEVWGRSRDELYERPEAFVEAIHPEDQDRVAAALEDIEDGGYDVTYRVVQPGGEIRWIHDRGFPIQGPTGEIERFAGLAMDITPQREHAEERAQQARTQARAAELQQLIFATSHTLRTQVRRIASFSQLLEQRAQDAAGDRLDEPLAEILDGSRNLQRLHDALREYAETTQGQGLLQPVDLNDVAREVLAEHAASIEGRGGSSTVGEIPLVQGDPEQMRQLLDELVTNAVRFRGEAPLKIQITAHNQGDMVQVDVRDNGKGFKPEYSERVFGIFQQLDPSPDEEGVGIGLTICRRIVENHGGTIHADATPGEGATFSFTVPAAA